MAKPKTEDASEEAKKIVDDAKNFIEKAIGDIGKTSATKQLILGTASGWYVRKLLFKLINYFFLESQLMAQTLFLGLPVL